MFLRPAGADVSVNCGAEYCSRSSARQELSGQRQFHSGRVSFEEGGFVRRGVGRLV